MARQANKTEFDINLGGQIRFYRVASGMSQAELGKKLNLTFQQVQKYEKGVNKISAHRLLEVSVILNIPYSTLLIGSYAPETQSAIEDLTKQSLVLFTLYKQIPERKKKMLVDFAKVLGTI